MNREQRKYLDLYYFALEDAWNDLSDEERKECMTFERFVIEHYYKWLHEE